MRLDGLWRLIAQWRAARLRREALGLVDAAADRADKADALDREAKSAGRGR
jgi:hypothetical protein